MKSYLWPLAVLCAFTSSPSRADIQEFDLSVLDQFAPAIVDAAPDTIFTPMSFDDQHEAQVVLDGTLPGYCYKVKPTLAPRIDMHKKQIFIRQQMYYYPGAWCAETPIPYTVPVNLGLLKPGQYEIFIETEGAKPQRMATLPIAIGSASAQTSHQEVYTAISGIDIKRAASDDETPRESRNYQITMKGTYNDSCIRFSRVETRVYSNHVIEVLPYSEVSAGPCLQQVWDFDISQDVKNLPHGRYLIHIRTLNGIPYNTVVDL